MTTISWHHVTLVLDTGRRVNGRVWLPPESRELPHTLQSLKVPRYFLRR
jgi:hypothetical protein